MGGEVELFGIVKENVYMLYGRLGRGWALLLLWVRAVIEWVAGK